MYDWHHHGHHHEYWHLRCRHERTVAKQAFHLPPPMEEWQKTIFSIWSILLRNETRLARTAFRRDMCHHNNYTRAGDDGRLSAFEAVEIYRLRGEGFASFACLLAKERRHFSGYLRHHRPLFQSECNEIDDLFVISSTIRDYGQTVHIIAIAVRNRSPVLCHQEDVRLPVRANAHHETLEGIAEDDGQPFGADCS